MEEEKRQQKEHLEDFSTSLRNGFTSQRRKPPCLQRPEPTGTSHPDFKLQIKPTSYTQRNMTQCRYLRKVRQPGLQLSSCVVRKCSAVYFCHCALSDFLLGCSGKICQIQVPWDTFCLLSPTSECSFTSSHLGRPHSHLAISASA